MSDGFYDNVVAPAFEVRDPRAARQPMFMYPDFLGPLPPLSWNPRATRTDMPALYPSQLGQGPLTTNTTDSGAFSFGSVPGGDLFVSRPMPENYPYGPLSWTEQEKRRIESLPFPEMPSNLTNVGPGMWRRMILEGQTPDQIIAQFGQPGDVYGGTTVGGGETPNLYLDTLMGAAQEQQDRAESEAGWADLIAALGAQSGGGGGYTPVTVDRSLFRLAETPEEQALLARELAEIEARTTAGRAALSAGWANVADTNRRAAEKARAQVLEYGDAAAAGWMDAASRAQELAASRAQQAGQFEGRQAINVSPTGGAEDFIMFMQSQAPAARQFAERSQETLARDLDWMSGMAGQQGEAYSAELARQANMMAFESAREHNRAVQERINAERMALADMEFRAATTNAQLAQAAARETGQRVGTIQPALVEALLGGDAEGPAILAFTLGLSPEQAQRLYNSAKSSPLGISLLNQATSG